MWAGIWNAIKLAAIAMGWAKQKSDQNTGGQLQQAKNQKELTNEVQAVRDARNTPAVVDGVRERSLRD